MRRFDPEELDWFECSREAMVIVRPGDTRVLYINTQAHQLLGPVNHEWLGDLEQRLDAPSFSRQEEGRTLERSIDLLSCGEGVLLLLTFHEVPEPLSIDRETQLQLLSELTADCCWMRVEEVSGRTSRDWITGSFERLTGYTTEEFQMIGRDQLVHPADLSAVKAYVHGPVGTSEHEFRIITKGGDTRWLQERMSVLDWEDGSVVVLGATRDITERKRVEQSLLTSQEQLFQSQKIEALGQLAGGIAHDFNNLLTVINGYTEVMMQEVNDDPDLIECLTEIKTATQRATSLTRQFLAFGRRQTLQPRVVDLNHLVHGMILMLRRLVTENIEIVLSLNPDISAVKIDPSKFENAIVNLVVNARDALSPDGGRITLETLQVDFDEQTRACAPSADGSHVLLRVRDTGCGMDKDTLSRVFEPFFTTKRVGEGTGLGLAAVYGTVTQSGGRILVDSELGEGTVITLFLARSQEPLEVRNETNHRPRHVCGAETLLLVEDEESVRQLISNALTRLGYTVLQAKDPIHAIALVSEEETIELLITDIVMPRMNGIDLAHQVQSVRPAVKVLFMSGYPSEVLAGENRFGPEINFISKPLSAETLALTIRQILDRPG